MTSPAPREAATMPAMPGAPCSPRLSISPPKAHAAVSCLQIGVAHVAAAWREEDVEGLEAERVW